MLKSKLIHPAILHALAASGHGSQVLIADGNYPFSTGANPGAARVYLNLMPGLVSVTQALEALTSAMPVEAAHVMVPDQPPEPPIFAEFRNWLPGMNLTTHSRFAFYALARGQDVALVIASGDQRLYANILLTIGVVPPA